MINDPLQKITRVSHVQKHVWNVWIPWHHVEKPTQSLSFITVSWGVYSSLSHVYVLVVIVYFIMTFLTTYLCTIYSVWIHVNYCQIRLLKTTRDVFEQLSIFLLLQNMRAEWETRFFSIVTQDELVIGDWNKSKWFYLIFVCVVLLMHVGCLKMLLFKVT